MNSTKNVLCCLIVLFLFLLIFYFHVNYLNGKIEYTSENYEASLESLLLKFSYKPLIIDSFILDDKIVENRKANEFLEILNKYNQSQFDKLINEVNKNSLQFNKILASADSRLSRELNNLNMWVTLWVWVFSIFTIVLPLISYHFSTKDLNTKIKIMTYEIKTNNNHLTIYTILSVLKELSGQPPAFYEFKDRNKFVHGLLSDASSKMKCIFQNEKKLFDKKTKQFKPTVELLFIEISIAMRQIQTYFDKRELIVTIEKIINLSDDIKEKINKPISPNLKKEFNIILSLFDSLTGLISVNNPDPR